MNFTTPADDPQYQWSYEDYENFVNTNASEIKTNLKFAGVGVLTSGLNIATSGALICAILITHCKHLQEYHRLEMTFAVANLAFNILVSPLTIYDDIYRDWKIGSHLCKLWTVSQYVLLQLISVTMVLSFLNQALLACTPNIHSKIMKRFCGAGLLCLPLLLTAVAIIPQLVLGVEDNRVSDSGVTRGHCVISMELGFAFGINCTTYILPTFSILVLTVAIILGYGGWDSTEDQAPSSHHSNPNGSLNNEALMRLRLVQSPLSYQSLPFERSEDELLLRRKTAWAVCFAGILFVAMWFPFYMVDSLLILCGFSCTATISENTIKVFHWLGIANGIVTSTIFLSIDKIRNITLRERFSQGTVCEIEMVDDPKDDIDGCSEL